MAGRFERIELGHWTAAAMHAELGLSEHDAAEAIVREGAYPGAFRHRDDDARWTAYVRDAIIEPAIGRDILSLGPVRKPALLRQVFSVAATSPALIISLQKIQGQLQDRGAIETVASYLALCEEAFLVAALPKFSPHLRRGRAAPPKLVTLSNALLRASDPRGAPDPSLAPDRWGAWVENACLAHAWNAGQRVSYWREEPLEVDAVVQGSWGSWAIEVKTGRVTAADLRGLAELTQRHRELLPLVLCDEANRIAVERSGLPALDWRAFLLRGPPR